MWSRPAATVPIGPLAWEPPYAMSAALKRKKERKKKKRSDLWLPQMGRGRKGDLNEGSQKAQTSSYKINKF